MTSSEYRSSVTVPIKVAPATKSSTSINSRLKSTSSTPSFRRSASVTNFRSTSGNSVTGKKTNVVVGGDGTTVNKTTEQVLPEDGQPLSEDWLVAKYRHVFAGQGGLYRPFQRSSSATMMTSALGGYPIPNLHHQQSVVEISSRKLSVSMQPIVAFGSTVRQQRRATSARITTGSSLYCERLNQRPETAVRSHSRQWSATGQVDADTELAGVNRRTRSLVVHLVGSEQSQENEFIIEDCDDDDGNDDREEEQEQEQEEEEEDVDSGFNRDESLTRDSSISGQQIDEWITVNKDRDGADSHRTDRNPRDRHADTDGNGVQLDQRHHTLSVVSPVKSQSRVTSTVTTTTAGWDNHYAMKTLKLTTDENEDGSQKADRKLIAYVATATTMPPGGVFSSMSNEARRALLETRSDMRRTRDSRHVGLTAENSESDVGINSTADDEAQDQNCKLQARSSAQPQCNVTASRSQRPKSVSAATRQNRDRIIQQQKADLISASAVSSTAWSRRHGAAMTGDHVTEKSRRFPQRNAVRDPSARGVQEAVILSSVDSRLAAAVDASSSASRRRSTHLGQRSSTGLAADLRASDKDHSSRVNREPPVAQVAANACVTVAVGDFRITPATYDSRYADMMAAAALDERWRERGGSNGVGRWNENLETGVDRLIRDLAVAKCSDWLAKQQQQHPPSPLERKRFITMSE